MKTSALNKLVKQFNGWWDGDTARFPTPHEKDQFLKALKEAKSSNKD